MAELNESNWRPVTFGQPGSDTIAARSIVAGFAPDNVGSQNAKALRLDTSVIPGTAGESKFAGYFLDNDLGILPSSAQVLQGWMQLDQTGPETQDCILGLKIIENQVDPTDIPTGLFINFVHGTGTLEILVAVVSNAGIPEYFNGASVPFADATKPFFGVIKFEEVGNDLVAVFEAYDETGTELFSDTTTVFSSDLVGTEGMRLFATSGVVGQSGSGCSFDDISLDAETGLTPLAPIAAPVEIDFEDASWG